VAWKTVRAGKAGGLREAARGREEQKEAERGRSAWERQGGKEQAGHEVCSASMQLFSLDRPGESRCARHRQARESTQGKQTIVVFRSGNMGDGWRASLKALTDLVMAADKATKAAVRDPHMTRGGGNRHRWWIFGKDSPYMNVSLDEGCRKTKADKSAR
jgi:hypothetical protein